MEKKKKRYPPAERLRRFLQNGLPAEKRDRVILGPPIHVSHGRPSQAILLLLGEPSPIGASPGDKPETLAHRRAVLSGQRGASLLVPHLREKIAGVACVLSLQYERLLCGWERERLLLLPPLVLPFPRASQETSLPPDRPLFVCSDSNLDTSRWIREAVKAVWTDNPPRFLILPPSYSDDAPILLSGATDSERRDLRGAEAAELVRTAELILHLPAAALSSHDVEAVSFLSTGVPCLAFPSGWWAELPEDTFLPFEGEERDKAALIEVLRAYRATPYLGPFLSRQARSFSESAASTWRQEIHSFLDRAVPETTARPDEH